MGAKALTAKTRKENGIKAARTYIKRHGHGTFYGGSHTQETKKKISEFMKNRYIGEKNSQYGTCWIYSLTKKTNKKIIKTELNSYIKCGWLKGRKMKF